MPLFTQHEFLGWTTQESSIANPGSFTVLSNFERWPDGTIRSRMGSQTVESSATGLVSSTGGTNIHSTHLRGTFRYYGISNDIYRNPTTPASVQLGLNGSRLSFADMAVSPVQTAAWVFFTNGQAIAQVKDSGTTTLEWGIDGPTTACVTAVTTGVPTDKQIDSMNAAWTAVAGDTALTVALDAATQYEGANANTFTVTAGGTGRARSAAYLNAANGDPGRLSVFGDGSVSVEADVIRVMLRCDVRQNLDHVEIAFNISATTTFIDDYYFYRFQPTDFSQDNTWQEFKIAKSLFTRVRPAAGSVRTWQHCNGAQATTAASSRGSITVSMDDLRLQKSATHPDGIYKYKVTFYNTTTGNRSNSIDLATFLSSNGLTERVSNEVRVSKEAIALTSIPTAPATGRSGAANGTIYREIWRTLGSGGGTYYRVTTITDNTTTTYTDTTDDSGLTLTLVDDNFIPPIARAVGGPWFDRLWMWGMNNITVNSGEEEGPHVLRYSKASRPESWPQFNYVVVSAPDDLVQSLVFWSGSLFAVTQRTIKRIIGLNATAEQIAGAFVATPTEAETGTSAPYAVAPSPVGIFYPSLDGVYLFNGITSQNISNAMIRSLWQGQIVTVDGVIQQPVDISAGGFTNMLGDFYLGRYYLVYRERDNTTTQHVLIYDVATQQWFTRDYLSTIRRLQREEDTQNTQLTACTSDGHLLRIAAPLNVDGVSALPFKDTVGSTNLGGITFPCVLQTKSFDTEFKVVDHEAYIKDISLDIDTGGQNVTVEAIFDGGGRQTVGTANSSGRARLSFSTTIGERAEGQIAFRVAVRLTFTQSTAQVILWGVSLLFTQEPPRVGALTIKITPFRRQGLLRWIYFIIYNISTVTGTVYMDGSLYATFTIPGAGDRHKAKISLPIGVRGRTIRLSLASANPFKLYDGSYIVARELGEDTYQRLSLNTDDIYAN